MRVIASGICADDHAAEESKRAPPRLLARGRCCFRGQQPQPLLQPLLQPHPQPPQPPPQQHQMMISRMMIQQQFPPPPQPLLQHISEPPMRLRCRPLSRPQSIVCGPAGMVRRNLKTLRGNSFPGAAPFAAGENVQIHEPVRQRFLAAGQLGLQRVVGDVH